MRDYSNSENEVYANAAWLQNPPVSSAIQTESVEDEDSNYIKQQNLIINVNPVVSIRNHGFSKIQETSSPSSDSSSDSSPGATYAPYSDLEWQRNYSEIEIEFPPPDLVLQRGYSNSENEVYANAAWLQNPPVSSAIRTESVEDEDSNYIKQLDLIINVNPVVSIRNHGFSKIQETSSPSSDSSSDSSPGATYAPHSDLEWQRNYSEIEIEFPPPDLVLQRSYSNSENEVYANAGWLQNPPVSSAIRTESVEDEDSNYIKQLDVIINVNPVVSIRNHGFSTIQETSSPSSDSSSDSSPGATYVPPSDFEWQRNYYEIEIESPPPDLVLQRDYSDSENEVYANAGWLQNPPVSSAIRTESVEDEDSNYIKQLDVIINVNPVVSIRNHGFSTIQETSSPSSDSSSDSSPGATYVPPSDFEWQRNYYEIEIESTPPDLVLQRDYSNSENKAYANAAWLQNPPVSSAIRTEFVEDEDSNYIKQLDVIINVNIVVSTRNHWFSAIQEASSPSSDSSSDSSPGATYVPPSDLVWQRNYSEIEIESPPPDLVLQRDYSNSENEAYANAAWLQNPPVLSAIRTESVEGEDSNYIKQLDGIIDVRTFNCSLAHKNAFDLVDSAVFIENEKNQLCPSDSGERVEEEKVRKCLVADGKWIKHYNSNHRILLVGEGDFSFSSSLAVAFGSASNMIATSLDSVDFLKKNYKRAMSNIGKLRSRECIVMHGIDATEVASHHLLGGMTFDRIIFNFPFAGFFKDLSREAQLRKHRRLVSLFLNNAKEMIGENGEIHISHKTNGFHGEWKLESVASSHRLRLIEAVEFNQFDYKDYDTKYGFGGDNNFNCYPSKTYKFGLIKGTCSSVK